MHVNGRTEPVLMGESNPKVAYACGRGCERIERSTEPKGQKHLQESLLFSLGPNSQFSHLWYQGWLYSKTNNFIPKPPFLLLFILICVTKVYLWGDENTLKLDCGDG